MPRNEADRAKHGADVGGCATSLPEAEFAAAAALLPGRNRRPSMQAARPKPDKAPDPSAPEGTLAVATCVAARPAASTGTCQARPQYPRQETGALSSHEAGV